MVRMTAADIAHMIAQIGKVPSLETQAITQEILDAFNERIASLERQVRALRLQSRPFKALAGLKQHKPPRCVDSEHFWSAPDKDGWQECLWCPNRQRVTSKRTVDADGDVIPSNATLNESRQPGRRK